MLTSLLMNRFYLGKQYGRRQYLSVLSITIGIILCTLATANLEKVSGFLSTFSYILEVFLASNSSPFQSDSSISLEEAEKHFKEWAIGIAMLVTALVLSSYMAICQEQMYTNHGKHPREAMFYIVSFFEGNFLIARRFVNDQFLGFFQKSANFFQRMQKFP